MKIAFDQPLAEALERLYANIKNDTALAASFKSGPTKVVKDFLNKEGIAIPTPDLFHAHIIGVGHRLPDEPDHATVDRYIYVYKNSGLFEFKTVPGTPGSNDDFMKIASGACQCCNCCVFELE